MRKLSTLHNVSRVSKIQGSFSKKYFLQWLDNPSHKCLRPETKIENFCKTKFNINFQIIIYMPLNSKISIIPTLSPLKFWTTR